MFRFWKFLCAQYVILRQTIFWCRRIFCRSVRCFAVLKFLSLGAVVRPAFSLQLTAPLILSSLFAAQTSLYGISLTLNMTHSVILRVAGPEESLPSQCDPSALPQDDKKCLRHSEGRQTRRISFKPVRSFTLKKQSGSG